MKKAAIVALVIAPLFLVGCTPSTFSTTMPPVETKVSSAPISSASPSVPTVDEGLSSDAATAEQLSYLIEEEKLAHDVYLAMFELWGAKTFGNILNSEASHQDQVLTVMANYGVEDPRDSQRGVFVNPELQELYNDLVAKGSISLIDAFEVGVAIEELDIADLTEMLSTAKDADVIAMMELLRRGSENHLRAFNSKL